jgi:hypothetical protein
MGTTTSRFGTLEERFWIKVGENLYLRPVVMPPWLGFTREPRSKGSDHIGEYRASLATARADRGRAS